MKMRPPILLAAILLLAILLIIFWLLSKDRNTKQAQILTQETKEKNSFSAPDPQITRAHPTKEQQLEKWNALFKQPINFWGKVVDQDGRPIQGAQIKVHIGDNPNWGPEMKEGSRLVLFSDQDGLFEVLNKKGMDISVQATAEGYVPLMGKMGTGDLSRVTKSYHPKAGGDKTSKQKPHTLVLRKKGAPSDLRYFESKNIPMTKDGTPSVVTLGNESHKLRVEVKCWSSVPEPFTYDRYDWRAEIRVIGGQLQRIKNLNPFEAPLEGYQDIYKIDMPASSIETWQRIYGGTEGFFWVKLGNGDYAKILIKINTGRRHFFRAEVCYNADGTRNLDFDLNNPKGALKELEKNRAED